MPEPEAVTAAVARLYNTYPFPPDPLSDQPPPGYNWRWSWPAAYSFCTGQLPPPTPPRILDAGCGTGVSTEYLAHLNPGARVSALDISETALARAQERCQRSGVTGVEFHHLSLFDLEELPGQFDFINSVGVLHHLADPTRGLQCLAQKLRPGGIMHLFLYGALGRWEVGLMQEAIALLQGDRQGDYQDGVQVGRQVFAALPPDNRLGQRERQRWALDNQQDACFADMYVHPQETRYTVGSLFELIDSSGLEFLGFSNPAAWRLERLLGSAPGLMERATQLGLRERYRLVELLDPDTATHYEFFLGRPPIPHQDWSQDNQLLQARPQRSPCMEGWPSQSLFNYNYEVVELTAAQVEFLHRCDGSRPLQALVDETGLSLPQVRRLWQDQLLLLRPDAGGNFYIS